MARRTILKGIINGESRKVVFGKNKEAEKRNIMHHLFELMKKGYIDVDLEHYTIFHRPSGTVFSRNIYYTENDYFRFRKIGGGYTLITQTKELDRIIEIIKQRSFNKENAMKDSVLIAIMINNIDYYDLYKELLIKLHEWIDTQLCR